MVSWGEEVAIFLFGRGERRERSSLVREVSTTCTTYEKRSESFESSMRGAMCRTVMLAAHRQDGRCYYSG